MTQHNYCGSFTNYASSSKCVFSTVTESALRVSGPSLLPHPCLQSCVWTGPLSSHHQVPSCCLQVQTGYAAQVVKIGENSHCSAKINHLPCLLTCSVLFASQFKVTKYIYLSYLGQ